MGSVTVLMLKISSILDWLPTMLPVLNEGPVAAEHADELLFPVPRNSASSIDLFRSPLLDESIVSNPEIRTRT